MDDERRRNRPDPRPVIRQIEAAWVGETIPAAPLCDGLDEGVGAYFAGKSWQGHDVEALRYHHAGILSFAPHAYRYYLPAFMTAVLNGEIGGGGPIRDTIAFSLAPRARDGRWPGKHRARVGAFTQPQREAIASYLEWVISHEQDPSAESLATIAYLRGGVVPAPSEGAERLCQLGGTSRPPSTVRFLTLDSEQFVDGDLEALDGFAQLEELALGSTQITDAALACVAARVPKLKVLDIAGAPQLTAAGYAEVAGLRELETLKVGGNDLTDDAVLALAPLRLRALDMSLCRRVSASGLAHLDCTRLETLTMQFVDAPDVLCARLGASRVIQHLMVGAISDAGLRALAGAASLTKLVFGAADVSRDAMSVLASLPALRQLDLSSYAGSFPPGFQSLERLTMVSAVPPSLPLLPSLVELRMFHDGTGIDATSIAAQPVLAELYWHGKGISDAHVGALAASATLKKLTIVEGMVSGTALAQLATAPALEELRLRSLRGFDESSLAALIASDSLTSLTIEETPISSIGLAHLAEIASLRKLTVAQTGLTAEQIAAFRARRPEVQMTSR